MLGGWIDWRAGRQVGWIGGRVGGIVGGWMDWRAGG